MDEKLHLRIEDFRLAFNSLSNEEKRVCETSILNGELTGNSSLSASISVEDLFEKNSDVDKIKIGVKYSLNRLLNRYWSSKKGNSRTLVRWIDVLAEQEGGVIFVIFTAQTTEMLFKMFSEDGLVSPRIDTERKYTIALYNFLKERGTGEGFNGYVETSFEEIREALSLPQSYRNAHIENNILRPSALEIKEKFGVFIDFDLIKKGKEARLEFFFSDKDLEDGD